MLAKIKRLGSVVSLVPHTGIQYIDGGFNIEEIKLTCSFMNVTEEGKQKLVRYYLDPDTKDLVDKHGSSPSRPELIYSLNQKKAAETFLDTWLPLPLFRISQTKSDGEYTFDSGPVNWARIRTTALEAPDSQGNTHRTTLALDTNLMDKQEGRPYLAPCQFDIDSGEEFSLAASREIADTYLSQAWINEWVFNAYHEYEKRRRAPRKVKKQALQEGLDHQARYHTFLSLLSTTGLIPRLRFVFVNSDMVARHNRPIAVDLVMDIGNSRTCGMLVEIDADATADLNDSYRLELRSLSRPEFVFDDPFPSRVEFVQSSFGNASLSRKSGRSNSFRWPSVARVGFEAQSLSSLTKGNEGNSGLTTPKRYLWDTDHRHHEWRFNPGLKKETGNNGPVISGSFVSQLRENGEERSGNDSPTTTALFSRSSLTTFFISEILMQAFVLINSPAKRYERSHAEAPRFLRRLIFTMPTAIPIAERRLFERRVRSAIRLTWRVLQLNTPEPEAVLQWDEATGTQAIFLYNEIKVNFQGDAALFYDVYGRQQDDPKAPPMIRLATIDIGGGTTDLSITTYELEGGTAVKPTQVFGEGFNIAGDDILYNIIERNILPCLLKGIQDSGAANPKDILARLIGGNWGDQSEIDRTLRKQFTSQVTLPLAMRFMDMYEESQLTAGDKPLKLTFADLFTNNDSPAPRVLEYIEKAVAKNGGQEFRLENILFETTILSIDTTIKRTISQVLSDLSEVISLYNCDYLLISGRPCQLPAIRSVILARLPVPPDRIITMHDYKVGNWYPFRAANGSLSDPKTTAAVGAMVCSLSEGQLYKFHLNSGQLGLRSTARFVGEMEQTGRIKKEHILFDDLNLEDRSARLPEVKFNFYAPVFIGFRQLPIERWPATPLYIVKFGPTTDPRSLALPLQITLERSVDEDDEDDQDFRIVETCDANGDLLPRATVVLKLQTMKDDYGYWLDTGIYTIPR